jgi:ribonuclease Y
MTFFAEMFWAGTISVLLGVLVGYGFWHWKDRQARQSRALEADALLDCARREADAIIREAKLAASEAGLKSRAQSEASLADRRQELLELEQRLTERESLVNRQLDGLLREEQELRRQQDAILRDRHALERQREELDQTLALRRQELERSSHLTAGEARALLMKEVEQAASKDASDLLHHRIEEARSRAEDEARRVISLAIQRYAGNHTFENTTATVALQGDDLKGRIIGREGRNIRAFEAATGVTVLIDDTPNAVVLSGFDPVRREIARESMERLILDGRIHPTRIEEIVGQVSQEIDEAIVRYGEEAVFRVGLPPLPHEIVKALGRLKFRHSFSQNILSHSIEVAHLVGLIGAELRADVQLAKRTGLLHDIGKALDHEIEGSHAIIGAEFLKRNGECDEVVQGVASHHGEVSSPNLYGVLVSAADAISASRPGARSESMATYLKRLEHLEQIGRRFPGVEKCFAVQAGRELRVVVQPGTVTDDGAYMLARSVARKIEEELQYPGQIRVTVVRETRCIEFAK